MEKIMAPNGMEIRESNYCLRDVHIQGTLSIKGAQHVTLQNVEIESEGVALEVDEGSTHLVLQNCRLSGKTGAKIEADGCRLSNCTLQFSALGLSDRSKSGLVVYACRLEGHGVGISTGGADIILRQNDLFLGEGDTALSLIAVKNGLVAENRISGATGGAILKEAFNTVLVKNSLPLVEAEACQNLYIIDNTLALLNTRHNRYFIADGNTLPDGGTVVARQEGNEGQNGDNLTEVSARLACGANEALLPHINREQFFSMPYKQVINDPQREDALPFNTYIYEEAKVQDVIILPPGLYESGEAAGAMPTDKIPPRITFTEEHNHTTVYAYGVCMEVTEGTPNMLRLLGTENIVIKGLTMSYTRQSCGQAHILKKLGENKVLAVTGAGMVNGFGISDRGGFFGTEDFANPYRQGEMYPYAEYHNCRTTKVEVFEANEEVPFPHLHITLRNEAVYNMVQEGEVLACRLKEVGNTVTTNATRGTVFYDVTLYGVSSAKAFLEQKNEGAVTYYRLTDTVKAAPLITEELYNTYKQIEKDYGVCLDIKKDEQGRYRGALPRVSSIDATHVAGCRQGSQIICCLLQNMCDDSTNQRAVHHARLFAIQDGSAPDRLALIFRANMRGPSVSPNPTLRTATFHAGDRVYVFTNEGRLVCDTVALCDELTEAYTKENTNEPINGIEPRPLTLYRVEVPKDAVHLDVWDAIPNKDFDGMAKLEPIALVDNLSYGSAGFLVDNCLVENTCARGMIIKAQNGTIKNCTVRHVGMAGVGVLFELNWGESGIASGTTIKNNLFESTGEFENGQNVFFLPILRKDAYAGISVMMVNDQGKDDYQIYDNISIIGNIFKNRATQHAIHLQSVHNAVIRDNDFGAYVGNQNNQTESGIPDGAERTVPAVHLRGCRDITLAGNTYAREDLPPCAYILAEHKCAGITENGRPVPSRDA